MISSAFTSHRFPANDASSVHWYSRVTVHRLQFEPFMLLH